MDEPVPALKEEYTRDLVSVIIPAYNRRHLIGETLASVAGQDYSPIEIIVVDDGSTDGTASAVREFAAGLPGNRRILCRTIGHAGAARARNTGLALASGEYIQFLDSDDLIHAAKLGAQAGILRSRADLDISVSQCTHFRFNPRMGKVRRRRVSGPVSPLSYETTPFYCPDPMTRRTSLLKVGPWNEALAYGQDHNYFARALALGLKAENTREVFSFIRIHRGNLGNVLDRRALHQARVLSCLDIIDTCAAAGTGAPRPLLLRLEVTRSDLDALGGDGKAAAQSLDSAFKHLPGRRGIKHFHLATRKCVLKYFGTGGYLLLGRLIDARTRWRKVLFGR